MIHFSANEIPTVNRAKVQRNKRIKPQKKSVQFENSKWTVEQDIYLIEHSDLTIADLQTVLHFSEDEIQERKACLGLIRRTKQLRKFNL